MTIDPTTQTLAQLGDTTPEMVAIRFAELCSSFDVEASSQSADPENWKSFLLKWTGRKSGILSLIGENWLKPASKELKPIVGQELNKFKAHVETALEEKRREIEAAAEFKTSSHF